MKQEQKADGKEQQVNTGEGHGGNRWAGVTGMVPLMA